MNRVQIIAAVGKSGQLGLNGIMPWVDKEDLAWFRRTTMGGHVIMGGTTYDHIAPLLDGRKCWRWGRDIEPEGMLRAILEVTNSDQIVWVAGGSRTYEAFMPFVRRSVVTHINYDGPADVWMPPIWKDRS